METSFKGHMPQEASPEITYMDYDYFKLRFSKLNLASRVIYAANSRFDAQIWKESNRDKTLSEKELLYIDRNSTSLSL